MFCYQCEETAGGKGCTRVGVCGKDGDLCSLLDLLIYATKGISKYAKRARDFGKKDKEIDRFMLSSLFTTLTNVNFDHESVKNYIIKAVDLKEKAKKIYEDAAKEAGVKPDELSEEALWRPDENSISSFIKKGEEVSLEKRRKKFGDDIVGLQELLVYGLKGICAYAYHAQILGREDDEIYAFIHDTLDYITDKDQSVSELLSRALKLGEINLKAMEILDDANTSTYGHPEPTRVRISHVSGKSILVSGHDLKDLYEILKQTEKKGINVYTHGEMLPCHSYPELKRFSHLVGNYGGSWPFQRDEFDRFKGAIVMTTNCIQKPKDSYKDRMFTTGVVHFSGIPHIDGHDFSSVIDTTLGLPGFDYEQAPRYITVGFGRNAVLSSADHIIDLVKKGKIRHFFLIGGCDGRKPKRNYYTEFAKAVPKDCVILTLGCGKYRFNKLDFGEIDGIPRLLDMGQCNDAYSAIVVAKALSSAFGTDINGLPLSLNISWYEQKAVAILLTLLFLGVKNIKLGPSLPAFLTPQVVEVLREKFGISTISTVEDDLKEFLGR